MCKASEVFLKDQSSIFKQSILIVKIQRCDAVRACESQVVMIWFIMRGNQYRTYNNTNRNGESKIGEEIP